MVIKMDIDFGTSVYEQVEQNIRELPRKYQKRFIKETRRPVENFRRRVTREPRQRGSEQFIWSYDSAAQGRALRWWFAAIAGKIPGVTIPTDGQHYKRTGKLVKGIKVILERNKIILEYPGGGARYVIWTMQVPGHAKTGWKRLDKEAEKVEVQMTDNALKVWDKITDEIVS